MLTSAEPAADPFGSAGLRAAVLAAWSAAPARFREDANAEEALAIGGYADRVLIEVATNGVDAARSAGVPGRIRIALAGTELRIANTGAPLTSDGVVGLASLRASAKRGDATAVGHFGVGFTAVLGLTDAPRVISRSGGVAFDRAGTAAAVRALGVAALTAELDARDGSAPALRLPFPVAADEDPLPVGFTTEVRLPLRGGADPELITRLVDGAVDHLFWALPELDVLQASGRTVRRTADEDGVVVLTDGAMAHRFRTVARSGRVDPELLADRPLEERGRTQWQLTWVLALTDDDDGDGSFADGPADADPTSTVGAPTPTDERIGLAARLVGTFPVDDTRRRVAPGPLADLLITEAIGGYLDLVAATPADRRLALVPPAGFPAGDLDDRLRQGVLDGWATAPLLRTALGEPVSPRSACVAPGVGAAAAAHLAQAVPGLVAAPVAAAGLDALRRLGVRTVTEAEAVAALGGIVRPPEFWREVYEALQTFDAEALALVPVPLADGRQVLGPRGRLLPDDDGLAEHAGRVVPGLSVIHPAAVHPLLLRLGAVAADPDTILGSAPVLAEITRRRSDLELDDLDPDDLVEFAAVIGDLVAAGGRVSDGRLGDLILTEVDGEPWPASELMLPDAALGPLMPGEETAVLQSIWVDRWDRGTLTAMGVRDGFRVVPIVGPDGTPADLPDADDWWQEVVGDGLPPESLYAVADLDLIDGDAWPQALALLSADRAARETLTSSEVAPTYTAWWIATFARIDGLGLDAYRLPDADDLRGLFEPLPLALDPAVAGAVGVRAGLEQVLRDDPSDLLNRFSDPLLTVASWRVKELTGRLVDAIADADIDLPDGIRTLGGAVACASRAVVPDGPWWAQVLPADLLVAPGGDPARTAAAFDVRLASERYPVEVTGIRAGMDLACADAARRAADAVDGAPAVDLTLVTGLEVSVDGGPTRPVRWWPTGEGMQVDGSPESLGRAAAWSAGRWADRYRAVAAARGDGIELLEDGMA